MDEEKFNIELRKFLKKVGVNSQREIESAVRAAIASGSISGNESLKARVMLEIEDVGLTTSVEGHIDLE
ncbi:MAG: hypothetical protein KJO38_00945 [Gammaproteobacteria bacterium]|nr:hypothetical protein [Gammaproteobacteria bacterium]